LPNVEYLIDCYVTEQLSLPAEDPFRVATECDFVSPC
jgi:hypothetical protein